MNNRTITLLSFIILISTSIYPIIEEKGSISCLSEYAQRYEDKHVLIVCDIDNTLAETPTDFGGDQWFYGLFMHRMKTQGISADQAVKELLPVYFEIQKQIGLVPVEKETVSIIKQLQRKVPLIALTARSEAIIDRTITQLNAIDIDFTRSSLFCTESFDGAIDYPYHYHQGSIFCGSNNKGKVLFEVLNKYNYRPEVIIMIDDKEKNLKAVEAEAAKHQGVEFIGVRYNRLDHKIESFDVQEGERLLAEFIASH